MITKVSYRPYASGVNNTQTQPKTLNFKATSLQATEKTAEALMPEVASEIAINFKIKLLELSLAGGTNDTVKVRAAMEKIFEFLKEHQMPTKQLGEVLSELKWFGLSTK